ncbi:hypothetical protein [Aneurinibacillus aneurinilyticus]|uniref:hypothetical protein n=1 Tax=Aneurinibacillus aneurinilyticus TaxID=1391 RepID=UPI0023F9B154|nr:hypothetical protein [Aneurinibacillus aneurinilyticus]MCI1696370.1 hypothetical protein [Aneurinibacillus aneurinilyticus]
MVKRVKGIFDFAIEVNKESTKKRKESAMEHKLESGTTITIQKGKTEDAEA